MNKSNKHHYLPEFFLRGFTNEAGQFAHFDCIRGLISPKLFFPGAKFYDGRNSLNFEGASTDIPEVFYGHMDNRHKELLQQIQSKKDALNLDIDAKLLLEEFLETIFWRLPSNDGLFKEQYFSNNEFTKRFRIYKKNTGEFDPQKTRELIFSEPFWKSIKPFIAATLSMDRKKADFPNWQFVYNPLGNNLCSDEPFVFRKAAPNSLFDSEFIFPLTKHHLLVRSYNRMSGERFPAGLMALTQLFIFSQAKISCCCPSREVLENVRNEVTNLRMSPEHLFMIIDRPDWFSQLP